ncbi:MAG: tRNA (pseudouridine(54)-N(1))-methyltransferase TrmY [Candidatus Diapherotrites archaeon]|nr:tRNA (pseudouridine(54)-N(1))-methyltransferase TrmY [Candidatus Diapherotrites archaeon]
MVTNLAQTDGDFSLNGLPNAGRMDVICRCVNSAFWLSDNLRNDTVFYIVMRGAPNPPITLKFVGEELKRMSPDERNIASHIKNLLSTKPGKIWQTDGMGLYAKKIDLDGLLGEIKGEIIYLDKNGKIEELKEDFVYVMGDNKGYSEKDIELLSKKGKKVSLGKTEYLSSQCITIINYKLDG